MTARRQFCPRGHDTFVVGRDSSYRCLQCKREAARGDRYLRIAEDRGIREAERRRREEEAQAAQEAERRRRVEERERRQEEKYQAAIKRGGYDAAMARWDRACSESLQNDGDGLCQWEDDDAEGRSMGRLCYRPPDESNVYCAHHNRVLEKRQR